MDKEGSIDLDAQKRVIKKDILAHAKEYALQRLTFWNGYIEALFDMDHISEDDYADLQHYIGEVYVKSLWDWRRPGKIV